MAKKTTSRVPLNGSPQKDTAVETPAATPTPPEANPVTSAQPKQEPLDVPEVETRPGAPAGPLSMPTVEAPLVVGFPGFRDSDEFLENKTMLVTDARLVEAWSRLDGLERKLVTSSQVSLQQLRESLNRVSIARNLILHGRDNLEEALRESAEVEFRLNRLLRSHFLQQPANILVYLLIFLTLLVIGFIGTDSLTAYLNNQIAGETFDGFWKAIVWGGMGGATGALYSLWRHVAQDQDYEPQYAMWYYTNPIMGVFLGAFVHVVVRTGALTFFGNSQTASTAALTYPVYFLAWAVGFQQNLAFRIVNRVLKFIMPTEEKSEPDKSNDKPTESDKPKSLWG